MRLAGKLAWWLILAVGIFIMGSAVDTLIDLGTDRPVIAANAVKSMPK